MALTKSTGRTHGPLAMAHDALQLLGEIRDLLREQREQHDALAPPGPYCLECRGAAGTHHKACDRGPNGTSIA